MNRIQLIEAAADKVGGKSKLAEHLGKKPPRISEWLKGGPISDEDVFALAQIVGEPALKTLCEVRAEAPNESAAVWKELLGKLTAAGVAATVGAVMVMSPQSANASPSQVMLSVNHCILCKLTRRVSDWLMSSLRRFVPMHSAC